VVRALAPDQDDPAASLLAPDVANKLDLAGYRDAAYRRALTEGSRRRSSPGARARG
jgi:hypothetical protein